MRVSTRVPSIAVQPCQAGLPPLFVFSDEVTLQRYANVTETAFRMLTQPLVEFFAEMLQRAMLLTSE